MERVTLVAKLEFGGKAVSNLLRYSDYQGPWSVARMGLSAHGNPSGLHTATIHKRSNNYEIQSQTEWNLPSAYQKPVWIEVSLCSVKEPRLTT